MDALKELQAYHECVWRNTETLEKISSNINVLEVHAERCLESIESELAQVSKEYKDKQLHDLEIKKMARNRMIERFWKVHKKLQDETQAMFVKRSHEI